MNGQKKKEEEKAKEKELNELFKVAVSQPKVPVGMYFELSLITITLLACIFAVFGNIVAVFVM